MKLSDKIIKLQESATLALAERASQMKAEGINVIAFTTGEPDFDTPDHIKQAAIDAIHDGKTKYTPASGLPELKDAVKAKLQQKNNLNYEHNQILISCGAKHAIYNILCSICNESDEIIIPSPYWTSYPEMVRLAGATPVIVDTTEHNTFKMTPEQFRNAINDQTKALILNSPSNPTGSVYSQSELSHIVAIAEEHNLFIISDEIYEQLVYDHIVQTSIASLSEKAYENTIVINGVSKAYAMTGWRIGYAAGPARVIQLASKLQSQSTSCPPSISQHAAIHALRGDQSSVTTMQRSFQERRDHAHRMLNDIKGIDCLSPDGSFYLFPNISDSFGKHIQGISITDSTSFAQALMEQQHVVVVPGIAFGADQFIRISYATSMPQLTKGINRISDFMKGLHA